MDLLKLDNGALEPFNPIRASKKPGKPESADEKKLYKACQEFESVMLGTVFKQMRKSVETSDPLNQGAANTTFREMLDEEMSKKMAANGGIGLSESLYRQLVMTLQ